MRLQVIFLALAWSLPSRLFAQQIATPTVSLKATAEDGMPVSHPSWIDSAMCDDAGNVHTRLLDRNTAGGAESLQAPIQEIAPERPAGTFRVTDALPGGTESRTFFVHGGRVYVPARSRDGLYVVEFAQDGSLKAKTKLGLDFFVDVWHLAVFKSGEYLLVGLAGTITATAPHLRTPFTAVFGADGRLIKRVYEPEDEDAHQRAEGSDSKYLMCCSDSGNEFVGSKADVTGGSDGNVYLLHGTSPPLIYVISPSGEVVHKLRIDAGDPDLTANSIKSYAGQLAIGFNWVGDVPTSLIKVIDLKGNPIADYAVKEAAGDSDPILACYNFEGFTLIPRGAETKLHLLKAKLP
jgi:hypothetical protein